MHGSDGKATLHLIQGYFSRGVDAAMLAQADFTRAAGRYPFAAMLHGVF